MCGRTEEQLQIDGARYFYAKASMVVGEMDLNESRTGCVPVYVCATSRKEKKRASSGSARRIETFRGRYQMNFNAN